MTDDTPAVDTATADSNPDTDSGETGAPASDRAGRLRRFDPNRLWILGLLAVPGWFVGSLEWLRIFSLFFFFLFWTEIRWTVEALRDRYGESEREEETEPTDWIHMGDWREWVGAYLVLLPTAFLNPLVLVQNGFQLAGSLVGYGRHRGSVPDAGDALEGNYRLPLTGTWTVVNGSLAKEYSHSWYPLTQRYAYDFVVTDDEGRTRPEEAPTAVGEYYCYDEPVLAPADGVVVDVLDSDLESPRGGGLAHPLKRDIRGNYVTIQHTPEEYSSLVHLVPGSVEVEPGDRVERGQQVARCGHSGNSSEPHLHFQVQDSPSFETAAGLPVRFKDVEAEHPDAAAIGDDGRLPGLPDGDDLSDVQRGDTDGPTAITAGQRVTADGGPETDGRTDAAGRTESTPLPFRGLTALVQRAGLGVSVGAVLAGVAGLVLAEPMVTLVLAACVLAGVGVRFAGRRAGFVPRPGGLGLPLGIGLVALAQPGLLTGVSLSLVFVAGFLCDAAVAELDRFRLRRAFERSRERPSEAPADSPEL